jgi:hypothetical protein
LAGPTEADHEMLADSGRRNVSKWGQFQANLSTIGDFDDPKNIRLVLASNRSGQPLCFVECAIPMQVSDIDAASHEYDLIHTVHRSGNCAARLPLASKFLRARTQRVLKC